MHDRLSSYSILKLAPICCALLSACSSSSNGARRGFGPTGTPLSINEIASTASAGVSVTKSRTGVSAQAMDSDDRYFGRVVITDGDDFRVATMSFQLIIQDEDNAYFNDFQLISYKSLTNKNGAVGTNLSSCTSLSPLQSATYDSTQNRVFILDAEKRIAALRLAFSSSAETNCTGLGDVAFGGGIAPFSTEHFKTAISTVARGSVEDGRRQDSGFCGDLEGNSKEV